MTQNLTPGEQLHMMVNKPVMFYNCGLYTFRVIRDTKLISSPEHKVLGVSYCDRPLSVVRRRASSVNFFTSPPLKPLIGFLPNFTEMIPRWSSTKVV